MLRLRRRFVDTAQCGERSGKKRVTHAEARIDLDRSPPGFTGLLIAAAAKVRHDQGIVRKVIERIKGTESQRALRALDCGIKITLH